MPRPATLRQKNGYWFTEAGGKARYFGRVDEVSHKEALRRFHRALSEPDDLLPASPGIALGREKVTVRELADAFLEWVETNRSPKNHIERRRHLARWVRRYGRLVAAETTGSHLTGFLASLKGYADDYRHKHEVSVRACYRWGERHGLLPAGFKPFALVEPVRVPLDPLMESDLPTPEETAALIEAACKPLSDLLRVYHATGARTAELFAVQVGDYQPRTRQLVLGRHKRSQTMRDPIPRVIPLSLDADAIVSARCQGRPTNQPIFSTPTGLKWNENLLWHHFRKARERAKVREHLTVYSFRHLFISEMLMAGVDVMLVARMAGTSVAMIEKVYGRFRVQSYNSALDRLSEFRRGDP